jgi:hypothetical protein
MQDSALCYASSPAVSGAGISYQFHRRNACCSCPDLFCSGVELQETEGGCFLTQMGRIDTVTMALMVMMIALSAAVFAGWALLLKPDLGQFITSVPPWNMPILILGGVGFAVSNALFEELIFRGVLWDGLKGAGNSKTVIFSLPAQHIPFYSLLVP